MANPWRDRQRIHLRAPARGISRLSVTCALLCGCGIPAPAGVDAAVDSGVLDASAVVDVPVVVDAAGLPADTSDAAAPAHDATAAVADAAVIDTPVATSDTYICPSPTEPGPDANVGNVPMPPKWSCPVDPPEFFKGKPPPAATLTVELGAVAPNDAFKVYQENAWVPMVHGPQGGFHIYAGLRVKVSGATLPKLKLQVEPRLWDGCKIVGYGVAPVSYGTLQAGMDPPTYVIGEAAVPGTLVIFDDGGTGVKSSQSLYYCNRWYDLRVAVRDVLSGQWGQAQVRLRTYDTAKH